VLEAVRNLLKELSAILSALRRAGNAAVSSTVIERIQEYAVTWSANARPGLAAIGVPKEVLERADELTYKLARLTSGSVNQKKLFTALGAVWKVLHEQVLLEVARIPPGVQAALAVPTTTPTPLFPEIPDLPNQLVPRSIQGFSEPIKKFLNANPFSQNVFIMISYRARLEPLIRAVKRKLEALHLNPVLARDYTLTDDLNNPVACLLCCSYGVAIFDRAETAQMHNPNVVYELGMMQLLKRPCVILKHHRLKKMPTDLLGKLYEDYANQGEAVRKLGLWWNKTNT